MSFDGSGDHLLLTEQVRLPVEAVVERAQQLFQLSLAALSGRRHGEAVPEGAGQVGCFHAGLSGTDDQDALLAFVAETAPQGEGLLQRESSRKAAHGRQRVLGGQDPFLRQELHGSQPQLPLLRPVRDGIVLQRMGQANDHAPGRELGQDTVEVHWRLDPAQHVSGPKQVRPRAGHRCP